METTGFWMKTTGARPVFVRNTETFDTRRRRTLNYEFPFQNTNFPRLIDQLPIRSFMLQHHRQDIHQVGSRKRPSTDTTLPAGGKRLSTRTETNPIQTLSCKRKEYLGHIFDRITLEKTDKRASKHLVDKTLKEVMHRVVQKEGGRMYSRQYIDAGSYPVKMKICKADEFDVNIPLNVDPKRVRLNGKVKYYFDNRYRSGSGGLDLTVRQNLLNSPGGMAIPPGYAVVEVETESILPHPQLIFRGNNLSSKFLHRDLQGPLSVPFNPFTRQSSCFYSPNSSFNRSTTLQGCIDLIPLDVKRDLCERITVALTEMHFLQHQHPILNVSIRSVSHGPALKMTIRTGRGSFVKHDISVDITASLQCDIPVSTFGWPRDETKRAFSMEHINEVLKAGTHLVPKKDLFWAISFSKAERTLLSSLDRDQGCRKYVAKILKKFVMTCSSQSSTGLPGISSHIIKTQVLWSCEKHSNCPNYWHRENRDVCVINTMTELENTLSSRRQPDYFNPALNILIGKDTTVLNKLVRFLQEKRNELNLMI